MPVAWTTGAEELPLRHWSRSDRARLGSRAGLRVSGFSGTGVDCAGFIEVIARDGRVFHGLDGDQLAGLFVVFNRWANTNLGVGELVQAGYELGFEDAGEERVWFLGTADGEREPVILEVCEADELDGAECDGAFGGDGELAVDERLDNNVDRTIGLGSSVLSNRFKD